MSTIDDARLLTQTDELVEVYRVTYLTFLRDRQLGRAAQVLVSPEDLERAIAAAIDALYTNRDNGGNMHSAGAEAAVRVLEAVGLKGAWSEWPAT